MAHPQVTNVDDLQIRRVAVSMQLREPATVAELG
jgi:hypothetical protein